MCIPTRTHLSYNNDKPWFTSKLRQRHQAKEDAYKKRDKVLYKQAKYTREVAKRNYSWKLRNKWSSSDSNSVWKGLGTPSPTTVENQQLADNLNEFYCRFEKTQFTPPATPTSPKPALYIWEYNMGQVFKKEKEKEGTRPRWYDTRNPVLTSWPPSSHRSSIDRWSCVNSPHASNAPPSSPS